MSPKTMRRIFAAAALAALLAIPVYALTTEEQPDWSSTNGFLVQTKTTKPFAKLVRAFWTVSDYTTMSWNPRMRDSFKAQSLGDVNSFICRTKPTLYAVSYSNAGGQDRKSQESTLAQLATDWPRMILIEVDISQSHAVANPGITLGAIGWSDDQSRVTAFSRTSFPPYPESYPRLANWVRDVQGAVASSRRYAWSCQNMDF